mmetsp:Transcript_23530/g.43332  ORF Transcript_23530/g.43332 Transcript_23530/m.43332 type:complete len:187 (-) Transcript_23530:97-657(-)
MALAALILVSLALLGKGSRLSDQDHLEPQLQGLEGAQVQEASNANNSDADDFGEKCCCYYPYDDTYKSNPNGYFGKESYNVKCPAVGCTSPPLGKYWSPCNEFYLNPSDVYCKMVGMFGCNKKSKLQDEVNEKWKECYAKRTTTGMPDKCMYEPIVRPITRQDADVDSSWDPSAYRSPVASRLHHG